MRIDVSRLSAAAQRQILQKLGSRTAVAAAPKRSKYGAEKTPRILPDGSTHVFDSRREAERYDQLRLLEAAGEISDLRIQVRYRLLDGHSGEFRTERPVDYVADFQYLQAGAEVVEDCKGKRTAEYVLKRKMMLALKGVSIKET